MEQYRLTEKHFLRGFLLEPGTVVGEGTMFPLPDGPSMKMQPLTPEAEARIKGQGLRRDPVDALPVTMEASNVHQTKA